MQTPSLQRRVALATTAVFVVLLVVESVTVYLGLRQRLEDTLDEVLNDRVQLTTRLARDRDIDELAAELAAVGIPARVRGPDGGAVEVTPPSVRAGDAPPAPASLPPRPRESRQVDLPGGGSVEVFATRAGVDNALRGLVAFETVSAVAAVALAIGAMWWASRSALRPLSTVVEVANRTAAGGTGERLRPDRPDTELGRVAVAFDGMLDSLETAVGDARQAERRSRDFLADAAHQLRTPLTGAQGSIEALLRESDPERRDRLLANLHREIRRMGRLVNSLLLFARLDAGEFATSGEVDLAALVTDEVERAQSLAPHLHFDVETAPCRGHAAEQPMREAIANLLDNARRHARSRVRVRLTATDASGCRITVADDGPGIAPADQERVFERFVSLDAGGGSGLGLPIARAVFRAHGGQIVYVDGQFRIDLPLTPVVRRHHQVADDRAELPQV